MYVYIYICVCIYIHKPPRYSQLAWLSPAFTLTLLLGVSGLPLVEAAGRKKWGGLGLKPVIYKLYTCIYLYVYIYVYIDI